MLLCGTGHRPDKIGGYDEANPLRCKIREKIVERLKHHRPEVVISGMALGFDQDLAGVSVSMSIPFIAAVPFDGQERRWPERAQARYHALLALAAQVVHVSPPGYSAAKMHRRNEWMIHNVGPSGIVLALWDGSPGGTASCVEIATQRGRTIDRIDPREL